LKQFVSTDLIPEFKLGKLGVGELVVEAVVVAGEVEGLKVVWTNVGPATEVMT
jgi:hypothetical protein